MQTSPLTPREPCKTGSDEGSVTLKGRLTRPASVGFILSYDGTAVFCSGAFFMDTHKRWSKLQKRLYLLFADDIDIQLHMSVYRMQSAYGSTDLPRYWITLGKDIIFDYPSDFMAKDENGVSFVRDLEGKSKYYPYSSDISDISEFFREYIDTPADELLDKHFDCDRWGLADILKAADRRIGRERLGILGERTDNTAAHKIIAKRRGGV